MKTLAMGFGAVEVAQSKLWRDAEIQSPVWNVFDPPKKFRGKYDGVLAYFVLQRVANLAVIDTLKKWRELLKAEAELHVHVPSAEWFARQMIDPEQPSPFALQHLFGLQVNEETFNLSAFTMSRLRGDMHAAGLAVRFARVYTYQISLEGKTYQAEQHHVVGLKR
ncbi:MAG: hypothetical protein FVQ83_14910 [Chloroflexi bacterium]|nr:hypothetical protein [Chloroflexota bacterium]